MNKDIYLNEISSLPEIDNKDNNLEKITVGSEIDLTIRRKGKKKAFIKTIKREIIEIRSVEAKIKKNKIGYLRLKAFNENSSKQLIKKISNFEKTDNPLGYILDLRNNPGGLLTQAIQVTDFFLDEGEILSTRGRKVTENRRFFAKKALGPQISPAKEHQFFEPNPPKLCSRHSGSTIFKK